MTIKAISFDIWDTLIIDDSDEIKRKNKGLLSKTEDRILKVFETAKKYRNDLTKDDAKKACDENLKTFNKIWHQEFITLKVSERLKELFKLLGVKPHQNDLEKVTTYWEEMELNIPPDHAPHVNSALEKLHRKYRLGIISDAIVSPGRVLRKILYKHGLLKYFSVFTFSDEVGASKPSPKVFHDLLNKLKIKPHEAIHIGDRPYNDIDGPKELGIKAILYTGIKKRELKKHKPDAVCSNYNKLFEIINKLTKESL